MCILQEEDVILLLYHKPLWEGELDRSQAAFAGYGFWLCMYCRWKGFGKGQEELSKHAVRKKSTHTC